MSTKLITPVAILSYPHLFVPQEDKKGNKKYSCALIFEKDSDLDAIKKGIVAVAKERFGDKAAAILKANPPIHGPDKSELKGYPEGSSYFNARSERKPGIVSRYADPKTGKPLVIDEDAGTEPDGPNEMYPGCRVKAYLSIFSYDVDGNRGVSFGLEGLQRWDEGERLDGRANVTSVFEAEMPEEADLADLTGDEEDGDSFDDIL